MGIFSNGLSEKGQQNFDLGKIYRNREDYANAIRYFNKALITDKDNRQILDAIAEINQLIKEQRKNIDTSKYQILYTAKSINTDLLNWYYENGYIISAAGFGNETWAVSFLKNEGKHKQEVFISNEIPEERINKAWDKGLYITVAAYGNSRWLIVMQSKSEGGLQKYFMDSEFPGRQVDDAYQSNLSITACTYGNGWLVVMDETNHFYDQQYQFYADYPNEEIDQIWDNDRYICQAVFAGSRWLLIHANSDFWGGQGVINRSQFPFQYLDERMEQGEELVTSVTHDGVEWNIIYTSVANDDAEDNTESLTAEEVNQETLDQALFELNELTGLAGVKTEINNLIALVKLNKIKQERGLESSKVSLHMVFSGNPGTGKTTAARLIGRIFRAMGLLKKGHLVEVARAGLVAEYVGQTAIKTNEAIDAAIDGILFIDEAYALNKGDNDFGSEAIETLLKRMEDDRDRLVVIIAGYTDEMKDFVNSNPGLKSRFAIHLHFQDYSVVELLDIFRKIILKTEHQLTPEAEDFAGKYFEFLCKSKDKYFGNARDIRNLVDDIMKIQSVRLNLSTEWSDEELKTIIKQDIVNTVKDDFTEEKTLSIDELLSELNTLTGLDNIKQEIHKLVSFLKVEQLRKENGLPIQQVSLHSVFYGPPGTGKTTVARLLGKIYKSMGLVAKGHIVETSRQDLVAAYVGQTAIKTGKKIDDALNGVLFIDEAYSLTNKGGGSDFGDEAIETLLKRMEDDRDKLVVIVAGYTDEMNQMLDTNPGLRSRFSHYFYFKSYTAPELVKIFKSICQANRNVLDPEAEEKLLAIFDIEINKRSKSFGNARFARNLFEAAVTQLANRVVSANHLDKEALITIKTIDLFGSIDMMKQ